MSIEEITKFEEIYEKYWKLAYSIALKVLRNEADAEDVVQQTFLYLFCHLEKVGDVDSPSTKAYIAKTAEHRAIDIIRAKQRFVSLDNYPDFTAPHTDTLHPLEDALSQLPERYRQLLVLHYIEGYSTEEISGMLHTQRGTVQKALWRAKTRLAEVLDAG